MTLVNQYHAEGRIERYLTIKHLGRKSHTQADVLEEGHRISRCCRPFRRNNPMGGCASQSSRYEL